MEALAPFRKRIDRIDAQIVRLLGERFAIVREVAGVKNEAGIAPVLPARIEQVKARAAALGAEHGLDPTFMRALYALIIDEACRLEESLIAERRQLSGRAEE